MIFDVGGLAVVATNAVEALNSQAARVARDGCELRDEGGVLLAVRERTLVDGHYLMTWRLTEAWPESLREIMAPIDLSEVEGN